MTTIAQSSIARTSLRANPARRPGQVAWLVQPDHDADLRDCTIRHLSIGTTLHLTIATRTTACRLADLVPLAAEISQAVLDHSIAHSGKTTSCRKGCSACCRYLAPVSAPEAQWLWEKIQSLPAVKRTPLLARFVAASRRILASKTPPPDQQADLDSLSQWYQSLDVACPMLEGNCCEFYQFRPIVCREFNVLSHASHCSQATGDVSTLSLTVSMNECLAELSGKIDSTAESIMLPLTAAWATSQQTSAQVRASADALVSQLLDIIRAKAQQRA